MHLGAELNFRFSSKIISMHKYQRKKYYMSTCWQVDDKKSVTISRDTTS
jgi:hypothetical protein